MQVLEVEKDEDIEECLKKMFDNSKNISKSSSLMINTIFNRFTNPESSNNSEKLHDCLFFICLIYEQYLDNPLKFYGRSNLESKITIIQLIRLFLETEIIQRDKPKFLKECKTNMKNRFKEISNLFDTTSDKKKFLEFFQEKNVESKEDRDSFFKKIWNVVISAEFDYIHFFFNYKIKDDKNPIFETIFVIKDVLTKEYGNLLTTLKDKFFNFLDLKKTNYCLNVLLIKLYMLKLIKFSKKKEKEKMKIFKKAIKGKISTKKENEVIKFCVEKDKLKFSILFLNDLFLYIDHTKDIELKIFFIKDIIEEQLLLFWNQKFEEKDKEKKHIFEVLLVHSVCLKYFEEIIKKNKKNANMKDYLTYIIKIINKIEQHYDSLYQNDKLDTIIQGVMKQKAIRLYIDSIGVINLTNEKKQRLIENNRFEKGKKRIDFLIKSINSIQEEQRKNYYEEKHNKMMDLIEKLEINAIINKEDFKTFQKFGSNLLKDEIEKIKVIMGKEKENYEKHNKKILELNNYEKEVNKLQNLIEENLKKSKVNIEKFEAEINVIKNRNKEKDIKHLKEIEKYKKKIKELMNKIEKKETENKMMENNILFYKRQGLENEQALKNFQTIIKNNKSENEELLNRIIGFEKLIKEEREKRFLNLKNEHKKELEELTQSKKEAMNRIIEEMEKEKEADLKEQSDSLENLFKLKIEREKEKLRKEKEDKLTEQSLILKTEYELKIEKEKEKLQKEKDELKEQAINLKTEFEKEKETMQNKFKLLLENQAINLKTEFEKEKERMKKEFESLLENMKKEKIQKERITSILKEQNEEEIVELKTKEAEKKDEIIKNSTLFKKNDRIKKGVNQFDEKIKKEKESERMKKIKRDNISLLKKTDKFVLNQILPFISSSKTFFNICLVSKAVRKKLLLKTNNIRTENIQFKLRKNIDISKLTFVKNFYVKEKFFINDLSFWDLPNSIQTLKIESCVNFIGKKLVNFSPFQNLIISRCTNFTGNDLLDDIELKTLRISYCSKFEEYRLKHKKKNSIENLIVEYCDNFVGNQLGNLEFKYLEIRGCPKFIGNKLNKKSTSIQNLKIYDCENFIEDGIKSNEFKYLEINSCYKFIGNKLNKGKNSIQNLKIAWCKYFRGDQLIGDNEFKNIEIDSCSGFIGFGKNVSPNSIQNLKIENCVKFIGDNLEKLEIKNLEIINCQKFKGENFNKKIQNLTIKDCNEFKGDKLQNYKFKKLEIISCNNFTGTDLNRRSIENLIVKDCDNYYINNRNKRINIRY